MTIAGLAQPDLETPRLRLRRLRPSDAALIALYASDARVARMTTSVPHPYPPGTAEGFVDRVIAAAPSKGFVWALDTAEDGENGLVGLIALKALGTGEAEVSCWVAPAFWGAGYAGEAMEAVVAEGWSQGVSAINAEVFQDNAASIRMVVRSGFEFVGEAEAYSVARGGMAPTFRYRLVTGRGR